MDRFKKFSTLTRPFTFAHQTISQMGFAVVTLNGIVHYRIEVKDALSAKRYIFRFPVEFEGEDRMTMMFSHGSFEDHSTVPETVIQAVYNTLLEVAEYLRNRLPFTPIFDKESVGVEGLSHYN